MPVNTWNHTLDVADVFHNDDLTLTQKRDRIVERIRRSAFMGLGLFDVLADELAETESASEFDEVWSAFYDEADSHRVWVKTF